MKTLSSKQYRHHDAVTFSLFIAMMILIAIIAITHTSCTYHAVLSYEQQRMDSDSAKWNEFLRCSEDEGDMGCDSCFYMIFGYHAEDAGYLHYEPTK